MNNVESGVIFMLRATESLGIAESWVITFKFILG